MKILVYVVILDRHYIDFLAENVSVFFLKELLYGIFLKSSPTLHYADGKSDRS